ncbi:glycoside hydrolase family 43 protein [Lapidilactobacillus bayanensis]|uniref:glycoside hydrolase family 43 protein n=1 Tax=Lapidilactobacillus bayanensis TaxID=2485998 RepID=UPI000F778757|nr:glycoside hydrolase family 43 protein [Lapidilactobacillus bayanensis]
MKIKNPILRGFNPDPSIVKVGSDYYLATSTFEWWPGIEIYHSTDLVNWDLISEPLDNPALCDLRGVYNSGCIWAPHLSYADGKFWLIYTIVKSGTAFKDTLNYVMTSDEITGPWCKPVFVTASGFDPALFHDDDGKHYFMSMLFDQRLDHPGFSGVVMQEFDANKMTLIGERQHFYEGTKLGVCEGPQILKKDGWYYLLCAAGGTGYSHASTVARSRNVWGPYENSPFQPLISTKFDPLNDLQKSGHACFVKVTNQEWYIVHLCSRPLTERGYCVLGRETALQLLIWTKDGWPRLANETTSPKTEIEAPSLFTDKQRLNNSTYCDFNAPQLPNYFKTLRTPLGQRGSLTKHPGYLRLYGNESLSSLHEQTLIARRWQTFAFRSETEMIFAPTNFQQVAGLILFYDSDNWCYLFCSYDQEQKSSYLQVEQAEVGKFSYLSEPIYLPNTTIKLAVNVDHAKGQFTYATADSDWQTIGTKFHADHLSDDFIKANGKLAFTGAMVGLCAQDFDAHRSYADFDYFSYQEK